MSYWVHVAGNIRFDSFSMGDRKRSKKEIETIKRVIGNSPEGSEGPLDVQIIDVKPPSKVCSYAARYSVNITGDLRDIEDFSEIKQWVKDIKRRCLEEDMWIRQGVITAVGGSKTNRSAAWHFGNIYKKHYPKKHV